MAKIKDLFSSYLDNLDGNHHYGLQLDIFKYIKNEKYIYSITYFLKIDKEDKYEYDDIFPVQFGKFEELIVNIPNNVEKICKYSYGAYPPEFPPIHKQITHEGNIDPINPAPYYLINYKYLYL